MEKKDLQTEEWEKCIAGEIYDCHAPIFIERKGIASDWCQRYNSIPYSKRSDRYALLKELFGQIGTNVSVGDDFVCGFGCNIFIGDNVSINIRCTLIDCNKITIGSNVLIAPGVQINTAAHPIELSERLNPEFKENKQAYFCRTYAKPVTIGDGCWIGAGVIILAGVNIGEGCVIGAGSIVVHDIPANSVAVGNPCRVIRKINDSK